MTIIKQEQAGAINGVPGRFFGVALWPDQSQVAEQTRGRIANQKWFSVARTPKGYGPGAQMIVKIRHDDNCKNGHETFSITADITTPESRRRNDIAAGGCLHDEIAQVFPELAPLIKWHLCSTDGPMHYPGNVTYHAGDRDHNGLLKGEKRQIKSGRSGLPAWHLVVVDDNGNEWPTHRLPVVSNIDSETQPPAPGLRLEYRPWCIDGEGKERNLDAARSCAAWPDAPDDVLTLPKAELEAILIARLPALLAEFRAAVEGAGFIFTGPGVQS